MSETKAPPVSGSDGNILLVRAPLVSGGMAQSIWSMTWPLLLTTVGSALVGIVDVQVAGFISPSAQDAVGLSELVLFCRNNRSKSAISFIYSSSSLALSRCFHRRTELGRKTG